MRTLRLSSFSFLFSLSLRRRSLSRSFSLRLDLRRFLSRLGDLERERDRDPDLELRRLRLAERLVLAWSELLKDTDESGDGERWCPLGV